MRTELKSKETKALVTSPTEQPLSSEHNVLPKEWLLWLWAAALAVAFLVLAPKLSGERVTALFIFSLFAFGFLLIFPLRNLPWILAVTGRNRTKRIVCAVGLCLALTVVLACVGWPNDKKDPLPSVTPGPPKIKTLHDLFVSDCSHTQMLSTYTLLAANGSYEIEYSVCGDFQTKSLYFSFFLPKSDYTLPACRYLPNAYKDILDGKIKLLMRGMIHQAPGERPENWNELKASGRIFVYSETNLLQSEIEALTKEYEKNELSPQFRSRDYEIMRNSPLYDGRHY
jgi:hypothetical protein